MFNLIWPLALILIVVSIMNFFRTRYTLRIIGLILLIVSLLPVLKKGATTTYQTKISPVFFPTINYVNYTIKVKDSLQNLNTLLAFQKVILLDCEKKNEFKDSISLSRINCIIKLKQEIKEIENKIIYKDKIVYKTTEELVLKSRLYLNYKIHNTKYLDKGAKIKIKNIFYSSDQISFYYGKPNSKGKNPIAVVNLHEFLLALVN